MFFLLATIAAQTQAATKTVSMNSFSAIIGNVGGDANVSYEAAKGGASTAPAVNSNEIRVYQNGGLFTVTANNGVTITKVVLGSSMATTVSVSVDGEDLNSGNNYSIPANSSQTFKDISAKTNVQFTCKGTDKYSRLYVNYLSVTYEESATPAKTLSSIAVSGTPTKTTYTEGDTFDPAGLTVTGTYSDGNSATITDGITWNVTPETLTAGTTSVSVTATAGGKTSVAYTVNGLTVNPIPTKTISEFISNQGGKCYLIGTVSDIKNTTYGNYTLTDESGSIYIYGTLTTTGEAQKFNTLDVVAGDKIKVLANEYEYFNGTTHEAKNVIFVEEIEIEKAKHVVTIETSENGTLQVKNGEDVVASGSEVEEGTTLTVVCTPAADYRLKNWQAVDASTHTYTTTFKYTIGTSDVTFKANFELIPVHTINWSVNGSVVKTETLQDGAAVTAPETVESPINDKVFMNKWVTSPIEDAVNPAPTYVTPGPATADVTYYAVFATKSGSGSGTSSSETLTTDEIKGFGKLAYTDGKDYSGENLSYKIFALKEADTRPYLQQKKDQGVYVKITAPSNITKVEATITSTVNSSGGVEDITKHNPFGGTVALTTEDCTYTTSSPSAASTNEITNNVATLVPTGSRNTYFIKVSVGARIWNITTTYGAGGVSYSDFTTLPAPVVGTLKSIAISDYTTEFKQGDTFSFGGKVMASYEEEGVADRDVTGQATFSEPDMSVAGEQTVTVSYTEGEITKTATYDITVVEVPKYNVTIIAPENGTLTVKNGETVITSGTKLPEGTTLTLEFDANSGYKLRYWQDVNTATHTHTPGTSKYTKTYTMTAHSVVLKAFFDLIPAYTYTWYVNGEEYTTTPATEGAPADPATPSTLGSKVFMGWVSTPIKGVTDDEPEYVTDFSNATSNKAFYAVFATKEQGEGGDDVFVCIDNNKDFASNYSATDKSWQNGWLGNEYLIAYEVPTSNTAKIFNGNASVSGSSNACDETANITYQNGVKIIATPPTGAAIITMTPRTKTGNGTTLMLKVNDNNDEDNNDDLVINGDDSKNNLFVGTIVSMGNNIYPNTQITYNETGKYWSVVIGNCDLNYVTSASNFQCLKPKTGLTGSPISLYVKKQGTQTTYSAFTTGDAVVAGEGEFILVQSDADLVDGREYIIVAKHASGIYGLNVDNADSRTDTKYDDEGNEIPVTTGKTSPYHRRAEKGVTLSGGDLFASIDNRISVLTLAKTDGDNPTYKFNSAAGYLCLPADDSYLTVNTTLAQEETAPNYGIEVVNSIVVNRNSHISQIKFQKYGNYKTEKDNDAVRYIGYNNNEGYPRFSNYAPTSTEWKFSTDIYLYYREAPKTMTLAEIEANGIDDTQYTISDELEVVAVEGLEGRTEGNTAWVKDNAKSYAFRENTYGAQYFNNLSDYDQSNWIQLNLGDKIPDKGSILTGVKGTYNGYKDRKHELNNVTYTVVEGKTGSYSENLNTYTMASFWNDNIYDYAVAATGKKFFFMNPKIMEVCTVTDAIWAGDNTFVVPEKGSKDGDVVLNTGDFDGLLKVADWTHNGGEDASAALDNNAGKRITFTAVVYKQDASKQAPAKVAGKQVTAKDSYFVAIPLDITFVEGGNIVTAVDDVNAAKSVKSVRYYNVAGHAFDEAQPGVNIVVTEYTDGSHTAAKVLR